MLFFLALAGWLRPIPIVLAAAAIAFLVRPALPWKIALPLVPLALYPPLAFDETLYHLPFVRALAQSGRLQFLGDIRFPVFPQFQELLCVPAYLLGGDTATHLVALVEVAITAALLAAWSRRSGWLAAALLLGSPLVIYLGTITYADAALMLFVTAGFHCLQRKMPALAGLFFGAACSVKYLGWYFVVVALVLGGWRVTTFLITALPTTLWLVAKTGNPVFPFFGASDWSFPLPPVTLATAAARTLRLAWDVTFARGRVNQQPPVTPLLLAMVLVIAAAAMRRRRPRVVLAVCAVYAAILAFLTPDSRYLAPLLPLVCITAARSLPRLPRWSALVAVAPGAAWLVYRLVILGVPFPREEFLVRRVPEYRALMRAGDAGVYVCGGEQLKAYARGRFLGDHIGPHSYARVIDGPPGSLAARLRAIPVDDYLVVKRLCGPPSGMALVYEDEAAQLWRVQPGNPQRR